MIIKINNTVTDRPRVIADALPPIPPPSLPPIALPATDITIRSFFSNWYSPVPVEGYFLDVASDVSFSSFLSGFNNLDVLNVSTYQIPGLDCSVPYYYRVRSYDVPWVPSVNSNIITAITISLESPVITDATNITPNAFTVNWLPSIDASGYYLDVDDDPDFTSPVPPYNDLDVGNVSTYIVTGLAPDTSYYYQVNAYNGACRSNDSSIVHTLRTVPMPLPVALPATNIDYISFDANWENAPADASGYYLDVAYDPGFTSFVGIYVNWDVGNVSTYTVIPLFTSTNYYYRIRYYDSYYTSGNSNVIDLTTKTLAAPVATPATDVSVDAFMANWDTVIDAIGYILYVDDSSDFLTPISETYVGDVSTYPVTGLVGNETYYYRLVAYNFYPPVSAFSNIIDVTTETAIYYACATFDPHFATVAPVTGFLNTDILISNIGVIGDYVIEWKVDSSTGSVIFISGEGSDPSIQAQHPITNEVVFGGTLYPIIKYAYIDGFKYTSYYEIGSRYSPDFETCLDPVVVQPVTCNSSLGVDPLYPYYLSYVNTVDYGANKSRTLRYNISPSTGYLAWDFDAFTVAEQLKIYYCTSTNMSGTLLDNFIHGTQGVPPNYLTTNLYPTNYPTNPRIYSRILYHGTNGTIRYITRFPDVSYNTGDYLKIEIVGSVYDPSNNNTNWDLKLKCLSSIDVSCYWPLDTSMSKMIGDPSLNYIIGTTCMYQMSYNTATTGEYYSKYSTSSPFIFKYLDLHTAPSYYNPAGNTLLNPVKIGLYWYDSANTYGIGGVGNGVCMNCNPGQSITYSLQVVDVSAFIITCTDASDYNAFVNNIITLKNNSLYTRWLTTPNTSVGYYSYYRFEIKCASTCGDVGYTDYIYTHMSADVSWNPSTKTITLPIISLTNNVIDVSCDYSHQLADVYISMIDAIKNGRLPYAHYLPISSNTRFIDPVIGLFPYNGVTHETARENFYGYQIDDAMLNGICDLSTYGFMYDTSIANTNYYNYYYFPKKWTQFRYWDRFTLTNIIDASTRLENWKLERLKFLRTDIKSDTTWETVYEVSLG